jgi:hypothetical protein
MSSKSLISAIALAATSVINGPRGVNAFPMSRISALDANNFYRCRVNHIIVNAVPPSVDDVDTDETNKDTNIGQMESLRRTLFAELEKMRDQFTEMSETLTKAKEREEKARGSIASLKEQQQSAESEKERAIDNKKSEFV